MFVFKQKTAYEMLISDWSSDVCSSDLGLQSFLADAAHDGVEQMRGLARPAGEGRAVDVDALRRHHLCLAIEGQMVIELVHDDMGEIGRASGRERVCQYV